MFGLKKNYYANEMAQLEDKQLNVIKRTVEFDDGEVSIYYINQLTDRGALSEFLIKPLIDMCREEKRIDARNAVERMLYIDDVRIENMGEKILNAVLDGFVVVIFSKCKEYLVVNLKKVEKKAISAPDLMSTLRGPRDSLSENIDSNISLLRYRIKDKNLVLNNHTIGRRTRTRVVVSYIKDIANEKIVEELENRLRQIDVDGIVDSGELQGILLNRRWDIFPQMGLVERSDMAAGALLEGKIVILVEGSALALIAPKLFQEFLTTCEDSYDNKYLGAFNKVLRLIAILISLCVSSIYVALVAFSTDVMAPEYTLLVAEARSNVPFNSFSEALLIEFMVELIREALIRVPKQVGPAIGIVGALIIGQAAAAAGIFSSLMLIIAALSLLSSFIPPDYTIINPFRVLKFGLLTLTAIFGLFGMTMGLVIITTILVAENSLGVPYMVPYSPFHKKDAIKSIMNNKTISSYRPEFLKTIDKKRIGNLPNVKGKG